MDNKQIACVLRDTAQLLEIDGAIIGRYRRSPGWSVGMAVAAAKLHGLALSVS